MAVKASGSITLSSIRDVSACYRYYLLQSSTLAKPSVPTARPPGGAWNDTEPTYTAGSTNSLYTVDLTVFSDGSYAYSAVSLSSSYEAAKAAYNKAQAAQSQASQTQSKVSTLENDITSIKGKISSKVWQTDITEITGPLGDKMTSIEDKYSQLDQSVGSISASVTGIKTTVDDQGLKLDKVTGDLILCLKKDENDQIVSMLNASADVISLTGNRITIKSTGFELASDGTIKSTQGTIGGWNITPNGLEAVGEVETGGTVSLRLQSRDPEDDWLNPKIGFYASSGAQAEVSLKLYRDEIENVTFSVVDPVAGGCSIRMYSGGRIDINSGGSLNIDDEPLADLVVSRGVSNGWVWRKWASGIAECGKVYSNSQMSTFGNYRYVHENFPFAFNAPPVVVGSDFANLRIDQLAPIQASIRAVSSTAFQAILNTTQTAQGAVALYAIGTYDTYDPT